MYVCRCGSFRVLGTITFPDEHPADLRFYSFHFYIAGTY